VFIFVGIPLIIIGVILALLAVLLFVRNVLGGTISLLSRAREVFKKKNTHRHAPAPKLKPVKSGKVIEVKEKDGIFEADHR
jgi:hypothetical protein